jgi:hypothetical protein
MRIPALVSTLLLAVLSVGWGTGCAFGEFRPDDPFKRQFSLEDMHKEYTDYVRWSKFDEAAGFVHSDERKAFLAQMPEFDLVRFTDWEAKPWEFEDAEEKNKAVIEVTYRGYSMRTPFEVKITEVQTWERDGSGNNWIVRPVFQDLDRLAAY